MKTKSTSKSPGVRTERAKPCSVQRVVRGLLRRQLHDFVDELASYAEEPANWPLTQQEQVAFVRKTILGAMNIRNSEEYKAEEMEIGDEDMAVFS